MSKSNICRDIHRDSLILDTETTGLSGFSNAEVIQIGIIDLKGNVICNQLIKPLRPIPQNVIKIHGITNQEVIDSPSFSEIYEHIKSILENKVVLSYNAEFDKTMLNRTCKLYHLPIIFCQWQCVMKIYQKYLGCTRYRSLPSAVHNAIGDCYAVLELLRKMKLVNKV